jgi:uncharacterized integral membrane protein
VSDSAEPLTTDDPGASGAAVAPGENETTPTPPSVDKEVRHTRISAAWTAVAVAALLGVSLIAFIVQNTHSVQIKFFGASGHIPVAVALLAAALAGALVVLGVGISRVAQLRISARRRWKRKTAAEVDAPST